MKLKNRILLILLAATLLSAMFSIGVQYLIVSKSYRQLEQREDMKDLQRGIAEVEREARMYAITSNIVGGMLVLALLAGLLQKAVVAPVEEREEMIKEKMVLKEQLRHSQKMEALGILAGSVAHDFNNLLTIIDGYGSLIKTDPNNKDVSHHAKEILTASRRAAFITRQLLKFSHKQDAANPVVMDLRKAIEEINRMLTRLIGEEVNIVTKFSAEEIFIKADYEQLSQVLMNLVMNARDAMPTGGRVTIETSITDVKDTYYRKKPDDMPPGRYAVISVRDTGTGMPPETAERIFEPFFTTKDEEKGTGLGLSIVYGIVTQSGGFIHVDSKPGNGTTFTVYLPAAAAEDLHEVETAIVRTSPVGSETILAVEDDPIILDLIINTLKQFKYNILVASDGWEALRVAHSHEGPIDMLLTDVVMPGMGGGELAKEILPLYPRIKALFISGYSHRRIADEGVELKDAALLEKPFSPEQLSQKIRDVLDQPA